jgi:hypothetical protein
MDVSLSTRGVSFYKNCIDGSEIQNLAGVKDLGVFVDSKLTFSTYISQLVAKAKQRSALLFRTFKIKNPQSLLQGYKAYILPILDYCSPVWSPCTLGDIKLLESVQRCFTRRIPGLQHLSYATRLHSLTSLL